MALGTAVYITAIVRVWRTVDILNIMTRYLIHDGSHEDQNNVAEALG